MIDLLVPRFLADVPALAPLLDKFGRQGRLRWIDDREPANVSMRHDDSSIASHSSNIDQNGNSLSIVLTTGEQNDSTLAGPDIIPVFERSAIESRPLRNRLVVDSFGQLAALADVKKFTGLSSLIDRKCWTADQFRSATLDLFVPAIKELQEKRRAAIFGAQRLGELVLASLEAQDIKVECFVDNSPTKQGSSIHGIPVVSLSSIDDRELPIIIATTRFSNSISRQLTENGFFHAIPYSVMSLLDPERFPDEIPYVGIQADLADNLLRYLELFTSLSDEKSRRVLDGLIGYRLSYDPGYADAVADEYSRQYFDVDLIRFSDYDVFVDLGGYDGDTAEKFIQFGTGKFKQLYIFEPDANLLARAKERLKAHGGVDFVQAGAYSFDGELGFAVSGRTNGSFSDDGDMVVPVRKLDSAVAIAPTMIKMDIEGAEAEALNGAARLIRENRPMLAIAAYHRASDLWYLVEVIRSLNPAYRFYLRHYSETGLESVIYAI